jgi:hypothetical protein
MLWQARQVPYLDTAVSRGRKQIEIIGRPLKIVNQIMMSTQYYLKISILNIHDLY